MRIQLVTPAPLRINNGNRITALRWAGMLKKLGHRVRITQKYDGLSCDALIALHARRSAESIRRFHDRHPDLPLIVVLTGTDLYRDIRRDPHAKQSLDLATRLVVLQPMALREIPKRLHPKTHIIYQSAEPIKAKRQHVNEFNICVIAHLRPEKDPLRAAFAVRHLPKSSRIQVTHIGLSLDRVLGKKARKEAARNPRYRWLGQLPHGKTRRTLASSHIVAITSKMEGSSNVLSEALASGVPVIASHISGLLGTLGKDFPAFFPVGDTKSLRNLFLRAESEISFYTGLKRYCATLSVRVRPKREIQAWRQLLRDLTSPRSV